MQGCTQKHSDALLSSLIANGLRMFNCVLICGTSFFTGIILETFESFRMYKIFPHFISGAQMRSFADTFFFCVHKTFSCMVKKKERKKDLAYSAISKMQAV